MAEETGESYILVQAGFDPDDNQYYVAYPTDGEAVTAAEERAAYMRANYQLEVAYDVYRRTRKVISENTLIYAEIGEEY